MKLKLLRTMGVLLIPLLCLSGLKAQEIFPNKTIRLVLPYPGGVGPDVVARQIAERLAVKWGQPVIVENKPGASGFIAIQAVMTAPADGYTLLIADNGHLAINPNIHKKMPFDSGRDFAGVTTLFKASFFIATGANSPISSVPKLIEMAKAEHGKLSYGSPFVGSPSHLGGALMEQLTGTSMIHVAYKETGQMFTDLSTGTLGWALVTAASSRPYVDSGKVRLLAVAEPKRLAGFEQIPTIGEAGGPREYAMDSWAAVIARKGTPQAVLNRISKDIGEIMHSQDMRKRLSGMGFEATAASPAELDKLIVAETSRYGDIVKKARIEPQ